MKRRQSSIQKPYGQFMLFWPRPRRDFAEVRQEPLIAENPRSLKTSSEIDSAEATVSWPHAASDEFQHQPQDFDSLEKRQLGAQNGCGGLFLLDVLWKAGGLARRTQIEFPDPPPVSLVASPLKTALQTHRAASFVRLSQMFSSAALASSMVPRLARSPQPGS